MQTTTRHPAAPADVLPSEPRPSQRARRRVIAGVLLALTGIGMIMSIITNEALYPTDPRYTTFANSISDLSGTRPPNSLMVEPNRAIFIVTMAVCGAAVLVSAYLLWSAIGRRRVVIGLGLFGVGLVGIAVFPGNVAGWHPLFAMLCFVAASVTAIMSRKVLPPPARYFAAALGAVALVATFFGLEAFEGSGLQAALGYGGTERWIAYPVLLWLVMFGSVLITERQER
jgi:hypothetical membrane protein